LSNIYILIWCFNVGGEGMDELKGEVGKKYSEKWKTVKIPLNVYRMVEIVAKEWDTSVSDAVKQMLITYLAEKGYTRRYYEEKNR